MPRELNFFFDSFNIEDNEKRKKAADLIAEALEEPTKDFQRLPWKKMLEKYDKYSLKHWLASYANMTEEEVDYIGVFYNVEAFIASSLVEIMVS